MTRTALEAAASRHGIVVSPSMSDRAIQEAVIERISPGAHSFKGKSETYVEALCAATLDLAGRAAEAAKAAAPAAPVQQAAPPPPSGDAPAPAPAPVAPRQEPVPQPISASASRDAMIRKSAQ